ncbi:MAG: beta galactosidase jelly roll domain-containing protein [Flavobacteriaceae bacterium]|nr:beta galactosidase jelly roll domain-containing protein [Flavobacteriaceae bacterium]
MNTLKISILLLVGILIISCGNNKKQDIIKNIEKQYLTDWQIESSTQVSENDNLISTNTFNDQNWTDAQVPTTVLRALVKAGIYPDPHFDLNNFKIPDANDEMNKRFELEGFTHLKGISNPFKDPYWFRTEFTVDAENKGKKVWLNFDGINYRADIWVNGKKVADHKNVVGMFTRFKFDISDFAKIGEKNTLAVKIFQVDHTGNAIPGRQLDVFGHPRGQGKDIFKDATLKFSAGWDCAPVVRDRNMGIYQDVFLTFTNAVDIIDPYIITSLPLPDTTSAKISISADLKNVGNTIVKGVLKGSINMIKEVDFYTYKKTMQGNMQTISFEKEVEIPAGKTINISLKPEDFPQLTIKNPYLWWPNGYGAQYLHNLELSFVIDGKVSDTENTMFGIREITSTIKELNGEFGRRFLVNGKRIFLRGGWLQPDMMLDMNKKRMYDEGRLLANANVNIISNEDMPSPPSHVMETYDKYGLLYWSNFYQCWTNDPYSGEMPNPIDADLAIKGAADIVKRYRNHASLSAWILVCETMVREEIYTSVRNNIVENEKTRPFIPTTSYGWDVDKITPYMKNDLPIGMTDEGAPDYTWYPHKYYYDKVKKVHQQMFRNELGVPSVPTYTSMKKFIFDLGEGPKNDIYPLDKNWAHHGAWDDVAGHSYVYRPYDVAIRSRYGNPESAKDYIRNAQYVNAASYRAMYEAANHRMWDITQGIMLWKLNSTWPTIVWQLYDWFLNPTSAYYYTKKALEPVHIQLNEDDFTVSVINTQHEVQNNLKASVKLYDFDLNIKWEKETNFTIEEDRYKELFKVPEIKGLKGTYFVRLILTNAQGKEISNNFYWFSASTGVDEKIYEAVKRAGVDSKEYAKKVDHTDLTSLERIKLDLNFNINSEGEEKIIVVSVKNISKQLASLNRLMVTKGIGGGEVLPCFWSDNFFTLLPGEEKTLNVRFAISDLEGKEPIVVQDMN